MNGVILMIEYSISVYSRPMRKFLYKHRKCNGFRPADEARARKKARIEYTYYCCYDCGERIRRKNEIESFGK